MTAQSLHSALRSEAATEPLLRRFRQVRGSSEQLVAPLSPEDCVVQSMDDASPAKWHLAHTTWFFETFVLARARSRYQPFDPDYHYLFNSYYNAVGPRHPRPERGLVTRPALAEVLAYRRETDARMEELLQTGPEDEAVLEAVELGLHHEQQHQELLLMDIKHLLSCNPRQPAYRNRPLDPTPGLELEWLVWPEDTVGIGHDGQAFCFDNERPRHRVLTPAFALANRPVSNADWLAFIQAEGYQRPEFWLSDGWAQAEREHWQHPFYWRQGTEGWMEFTLQGLQPLDLHAPVCHLSYYEADAFASWAGARLPTEAEWERAVSDRPVEGNFVESDRLHPGGRTAGAPGALCRAYGDVWEWTRSSYAPYPGFRAAEGALGEYNGKFMCSQYVLRGGACVSPRTHLRASYRNFYYPHTRWHFSGLRLARDL